MLLWLSRSCTATCSECKCTQRRWAVCYLAEGTWDLMGNAPVGPMLGQPEDGQRFRLVAGRGFVPQSLVDSSELADSMMVGNAEKGHKGNLLIQFSFRFLRFVVPNGHVLLQVSV